MDNSTEQLGDGVWRIEVGFLVNAYLVAVDGVGDAQGLTLVDSGTKRSGPRLVRSIRLLGLDPRAVKHLVLTHWHADHMGSAARFAASSAAPEVHAGRADVPAVAGRVRHPHRAAQPADVTRLGRLLSPLARPGPAVAAVTPLADGEVLDFADGGRVVDTPGHTAGHVSLLLPRSGVLLAGDALMNLGRVTQGFGPLRSARTAEASTLRRLAALQFGVLAFGHGPPVVSGAQERVRRLADRLGS